MAIGFRYWMSVDFHLRNATWYRGTSGFALSSQSFGTSYEACSSWSENYAISFHDHFRWRLNH